jgi:hypothetical protein
MKRHKILYSILLAFIPLFVLTSSSVAQEVKRVGTSAAPFLRIPVGARGASMGSAFVAMATDASSMFWNPGGMSRAQNISLFVDYSPWLPGIDFSYFGFLIPIESFGSLGINVTALTSERFDITTIEQPMGTGETFSANSFAIGVGYARSLTDRFSIGANFKFVNESILNSTATGFMFDVGTLYDTPFPGIRLGVSISNIGTNMRMDGEDLNVRVDIAPQQEGNNQSVVGRLKTDDFDAPIIMRVGLSWDAFRTTAGHLTLAADGLNPNDDAQSVNFGAEYGLLDELLVLRGGYNDLFLAEREKRLTFGLGINVKTSTGLGFSGGFAYQEFVTLGSVNRFSLELKF